MWLDTDLGDAFQSFIKVNSHRLQNKNSHLFVGAIAGNQFPEWKQLITILNVLFLLICMPTAIVTFNRSYNNSLTAS